MSDRHFERIAQVWIISPMPQPRIEHKGQKKWSGVRIPHSSTWARLAMMCQNTWIRGPAS